MTNEPIKVIIEDETGTEQVQGGGGSNVVKQPDSMPNQAARDNKNNSMLVAAGAMIAMRSISYATSNVGKWTGNSRNQQIVNDVEKGLGYAMAFAANVYVGLATVAFDVGSTAINSAYDRYWQEKASEQIEYYITNMPNNQT